MPLQGEGVNDEGITRSNGHVTPNDFQYQEIIFIKEMSYERRGF